jgi:hypothetical protein
VVLVIYLDFEKETQLRRICADLFLDEHLKCVCGVVAATTRSWVSQKRIGVEAHAPCACGRGNLSVSTERFQDSLDLLGLLSSNSISLDYEI